MILDEANTLYDILMKHLTDSIMDNSVGASSSSDLKLSDTYRIEEPEIYRIAKMILLNIGIISNVFFAKFTFNVWQKYKLLSCIVV